MINFHDPLIFVQDNLAFYKLAHVLGGLYIWEFVTTLDYEWLVIQGRLPYRWTILLYSLTRLATLMTVIVDLNFIDLTTRTLRCQFWATFGFIFPYIAFTSYSLLVMLRVIAIWNKNKIIVGLATTIWSINVAFLIYGKPLPTCPKDKLKSKYGLWTGITRVRSVSGQDGGNCSLPNVEGNLATFISLTITDITLLTFMLAGLLRLRYRGARMFALSRLLWKQGVIWLLLATLAELPPVVFIGLNLNVAFNAMFLFPCLIITSTAATRMYRALTDFLCSTDVIDSGNPPRIGLAIPHDKSPLAVPTPPRRLEVAVHTTHEMYSSSLPGTDKNIIKDISYIGRDHPEQLQYDNPEEGV